MEIVKSYNIPGANLELLHNEISTTNFVANFKGLQCVLEVVDVFGDSLTDEGGLDALVLAHDPNNNPVKHLEMLQEVVADLQIKAKGVSINKTGSEKYIKGQVEAYQLKRDVANGTVTSALIENRIANEATEYGMTIEAFKALIVQMYAVGETKYHDLLFGIERCRTKIGTLIETGMRSQTLVGIGLLKTINLADDTSRNNTILTILNL